MDIIIDFTALEALGSQHPLLISWYLFKSGGWLFILFTLLFGAWQGWVFRAQIKYDAKRRYIFLAIDIPKGNEQTPKAVEHLFATLNGAYFSNRDNNLVDKYWYGKTQDTFSFEIISLDGHIQFLIYCVDNFRDLVEAAVYAQYPEAEINEVEDYAQNFPNEFPSDEWDIWGTELLLHKDTVYPIKTYNYFEHSLSGELKDPMASMMEVMGRLQKGERLVFQMVVTPISQKWKYKGDTVVKKLIGAQSNIAKNIWDRLSDLPLQIIQLIDEAIYPEKAGAAQAKKNEAPHSLMLFLSPGEKLVVEGVENKVSKVGFHTKIRFFYLARHEVFNRRQRIAPLLGAIRQFNTLDLNAFKMDHDYTMTSVDYFFKKLRIKWRKTKLIRAFKARSNWRGLVGFVLNIEELASLWHFPVIEVKAPLVKKTESRTAEPPVSLPIEE